MSFSKLCEKAMIPISPLGGSQNGKGFIGFGLDFNYEPGTFWDLLVETYAGPHDYVSKWSYDESTGNANSPPNMLIKVASGLNVLTATPFAVATLIAPTSRDLESFWPSNNK